MRRFVLVLALAFTSFATAGCFINIYSADKNERMQQLLNQSEDLRQIKAEMSRMMFTDQPSHMTYQRVHGGLGTE